MLIRNALVIIAFVLIAIFALACAPSPTPLPPTPVPPSSAPPVATSTKVPTLVPAAGPPSPTSAPTPFATKPGEYENSVTIGGVKRDYILHVPSGYDGSKAVPLVFVLYGFGGNFKEIEKTTEMSAKADKENFIVVYPDGTGDPRGWNAGLFVWPTSVDDVAFLAALIDKIESNLRVDSKRVYVAGFSNGAFMAYRLGAELGNRLAAIAIVEGAISAKQSDGSILKIPDPVQPLPVIIFHGKEDRTVPYNGGLSVGQEHLTFMPVADAVGLWVKTDGCQAPESRTSQNGNVVEQDYVNCKSGTEVDFYTIGNGQHDWPRAQMPNQISATDASWEFFARHPKP